MCVDPDPENWTPADMAIMLKGESLGQYVKQFLDKSIDGAMFMHDDAIAYIKVEEHHQNKFRRLIASLATRQH